MPPLMLLLLIVCKFFGGVCFPKLWENSIFTCNNSIFDLCFGHMARTLVFCIAHAYDGFTRFGHTYFDLLFP